jgi:Flp pilus assembly pilin Flp
MNWGISTRDETGQTSVEYALVIGAAILVALLLSGVLANGVFQTFWDTVAGALG